MKEVEFKEEQAYSQQPSRKPLNQGGLIGFFLKKGLAKNKKQAQYILIGILVACVVVIFITL